MLFTVGAVCVKILLSQFRKRIMAKSKTNSALVALIVGVLMFFVGGAVVGFALILGSNDPDNLVYTIMMYGGIAVVAIGLIVLLAGVIAGLRRRAGGEKSTAKTPVVDTAPEQVAEVEFDLDGSTNYNGQTTYVPQTDTYEFVTVGRRQSVDEKFDQIAQMGKTQFVIYIAKLFSLKGYEVQLTPVIENNHIDMIVKRDGVARAVGCLIASKVMCQEDIVPVYEGKSFYAVDGVMAVTNMYFDRTALNYAKERKMSLVDRNILVEQFMN